jgi:hypothetical protein
MPPVFPNPTHKLTPEQQYEFDLRGYIVLRNHYDADIVAQLHDGIDELQAIPVDYDTYRKLGVASIHQAEAMDDPKHECWNGNHSEGGAKPSVINMSICGTDKFDVIVRDPILEDIHLALAGSTIFISATYYIEKVGLTPNAGLHNGGFPPDRHIHYAYDHANRQFNCSSTKSVVILSDMTEVENGPFAAIPGSHKANFYNPFGKTEEENPMAVPVLAGPGDVIIFSEGMTHGAYPVLNNTVRRSVFFCYMPSINQDNLPQQRMSMYPDHVLERLSDRARLLTCAGYI